MSDTPLSSNSAVYEVQEGMDRDLNKEFRVTDTRTDSRVATCYVQSNADLVCAALNAYTAVEPSAGVKCTHCNGKGYNEPIYDEQDGWIDETPCETCNGSGRITTVEQYLKTLPANWHEDSSLETWFPITAEELKRLKDERASQPPSDAARDVLAERERQKSVEGWTPEHDDEHNDEQLALAAACYALGSPTFWPWEDRWWKPKDRRRNLVRAGALILAEIERVDRQASTKDAGECGACDKPGEHCANVHGICSRHGGRAHETSDEEIKDR